jgi:hypothetical protein
LDEQRQLNEDWTGRAYHTATLLFDRYLLVCGGMQGRRGTIWSPMLLDTMTWMWYHRDITDPDAVEPKPRLGASIVADIEQRNRLVLFGGGSGSDLLRSGHDHFDVWELHFNGCQSADQVLTSLPWTWKCLHNHNPNAGGDDSDDEDDYEEEENDDEEENEEEDNDDDEDIMDNNDDNNDEDDNDQTATTLADGGGDERRRLIGPELLNLGRCHASFRSGRDSVLLAFGSSRPSCNSLLGYRLDSDTYFRPIVQGPLPQARFTFAAISLADDLGYLVFHGGFCNIDYEAEALGDMCVLDLAAGLGRPFDMLPALPAHRVRSHSPMGRTNEQVGRAPIQPEWLEEYEERQQIVSCVYDRLALSRLICCC